MRNETGEPPIVETLVKLGGSTLADPALFDAIVQVIGLSSRRRRLLVVPGGGPFADTVRETDRRFRLSDDAAHWMAVLAMDQAAHLVAERLTGGVVVSEFRECRVVLGRDQVPVLAPSRCLQEADPFPHSWDVTGDSIAAWAAGSVGAGHLVLIKPPGVGHYSSEEMGTTGLDQHLADVVDAYFLRALAQRTRWTIVPADQLEALTRALGGLSV
jgi:aspartokinase-like uncharacterized kinase